MAVTLDVGADALTGAVEAEGYCWFGNGRAEEVVGEDDVAVMRDGGEGRMVRFRQCRRGDAAGY